ncbi:DeoR/GlpR family DNA-binding transcription regulator [Tropicimonas sp. IMCC34043]|uniref:DeoR/GlpR family DNA-binding transcription regulator n=1 Tax=Tropicimonas sp. IMCC34043 TaxID=2248760 RepID=UPI000E22353F|nr:DeoR/GlpR family DNA-binding transcription regulator [Tropicimonas sp. IMCC34043]
MIPAERQHFILSCLAKRDVMSIAELTERLDVSHMTIRRDIQALERSGRVISVSGGVRLSQRLDFEPSHLVKTGIRTAEKRAVGRAAADLVEDGMVIYLDAGTTMLEIAHLIADRQDLTVVTNDFAVAAHLSVNSLCTLYHTGGLVERDNQSCVGDATAEALTRFNFDIAFISTSSWSISGLSSPSEAKRPVKRVAVQGARRAVFVSDSSKYGVIAAINVMPLDSFDTVVTDNQIETTVIEAIRKKGVEVIVASNGQANDPGERRLPDPQARRNVE